MPHSTARRNRFATAALLAASAALAAEPAVAQVQVQGGNAHDANHQVGSGGRNRVENQVDYAQRNLLITGNVGGGRAFQDDIGYVTAGGFQDGLGSDSLFNFRRDSVYSSPQALGVSSRNLGGVVVTRGTTQLPGYATTAPLGSSSRALYDSRSGVLSFRQNSGALVQFQGVNDLSQFGSLHSLGTVRTQDGGIATLNASTLTGIEVNPLSVDLQQNNRPAARQRPAFDPLNPEGAEDPNAAHTPGTTGTPGTPGLPNTPGLNNDPNTPAGNDANPQDTNALMFNNGRFAPSMMLGNQIQQNLAIQVRGQQPGSQGSLSQLQDYILGPARPAEPEGAPQAPVNPYDALLDDIRARALANVEDPEGGEDEPLLIERAEWMDVLENPDEAVLEAVGRARDIAIRRSLGMVDENGVVDMETELPQLDENSELAQIIENLDYQLPRVPTLSGEDREVRQNRMLIRAEQDLVAGNYLSAESIYRQLLRESQDNPLARAGLVHAQLGGGMIRSAAYNLRALFAEHPELIALQYEEELLPSAERMRWLQRELQDMIGEDIHGAEPGLILAYLGYQLEAEPLIQYGLGIAQERSPRDPLLPVLERIWLERDAE